MARGMDKELELYRGLMKEPDRFEDGFGWKTVIGAVFLGFLMVPGTIYLSLFMGGGLGGAAQWVTVILFSEIVKRSMKSLRQQEIFVLFYMTGMTLSVPFPLLWNQYYVQSAPAIAMGVAEQIPSWYAPSRDILEQSGRTFFTEAWMKPILFMIGMLLLSRIDNFGLGYALYRLTAHVEKLPFPMAPAGALGITALAESREASDRWRWRCFSLGAVLGLVAGLVWVGLPAITGALFTRPVSIVPIPWLDLTPALSTERQFPAVPLNLTFDLSLLLVGMVLPFWAVIGGVVGFFMMLFMNPWLYNAGKLPTWKPGMNVVDTGYSNSIDFYLSFGIGLMLAIFVASLVPVMKSVWKLMTQKRDDGHPSNLHPRRLMSILLDRNPDRGDLSILTGLTIYVASTLIYIGICLVMMPGDPETGRGRFPWLFFMGFGFIYQPIISYVNAKLAGLVGQSVGIPMVREAAYILSGYKGAAIWFAPIPLNDYGHAASGFRVQELTGTRLPSILWTEMIVFPVLVISTLLSCQLIWRIAPVPSEAYPYTQVVWHQNALNQSLVISSTLDGSSPFLEAIKPEIIFAGAGIGIAAFTILTLLNLPTFLVYGVVRGLGGATSGSILFELIGALIGRYYFQKRFGEENFKKYIMILLAGYSAGVGLVGMASVAIALIVKSTSTLGY